MKMDKPMTLESLMKLMDSLPRPPPRVFVTISKWAPPDMMVKVQNLHSMNSETIIIPPSKEATLRESVRAGGGRLVPADGERWEIVVHRVGDGPEGNG